MKTFKYIAIAMLMIAAFGITSVFAKWFKTGLDSMKQGEAEYRCPALCAGNTDGWTMWTGGWENTKTMRNERVAACWCVKPNDTRCDGDKDCASDHCCSGVCKECCYSNGDCKNKAPRSICKDFKCVEK